MGAEEVVGQWLSGVHFGRMRKVVDAMRQTVTNMLGTLPPQFFQVTISTVPPFSPPPPPPRHPFPTPSSQLCPHVRLGSLTLPWPALPSTFRLGRT